MKVLLFWVVVAWLVAVIADRPCAEYCVYLSSGTRNIDFQPGCDCMYEENDFQEPLDDSGIYYEPVNYIPFPAYKHNQPFYILNPISQGRQTDSTNNYPAMPENVEPALNTQTYNTEIEVNTDNTHSVHNRQEKDVLSNNHETSAPLYLDMNVEIEDVERSSSTNSFTTEELKVIEQSLLECAEVFAVLNSRKSKEANGIDTIRPYQFNENGDISQVEHIKVIQSKCSHVSNFVEKSMNEIKNTRPKFTRITFTIDNEDQKNDDESHANHVHNTNEHTLCSSSTEKYVHSSNQIEDNESGSKDYNQNQEHAIIIYTNSGVNARDNINTSPSEVSSTTAASTSVSNFQYFTNVYPKPEDISAEVARESFEQFMNNTRNYTNNEYPLQEDTIAFNPTTVKSEFSTSPTITFDNTNTVKEGVIKNRPTDQEFEATSVEGVPENRSQYEEGEVPLIKIITHEFGNNTVQSFINGTEDIPNEDFIDEMKTTGGGSEAEDSEKMLTFYQHTGSTSAEFETSAPNTGHGKSVPDISGNLYFVFNDHQIPARFIQNLNGSLHLGIDGGTLCNTLTQDGEYNSALLKTLCNCYKNGNCTQKP